MKKRIGYIRVCMCEKGCVYVSCVNFFTLPLYTLQKYRNSPSKMEKKKNKRKNKKGCLSMISEFERRCASPLCKFLFFFLVVQVCFTASSARAKCRQESHFQKSKKEKKCSVTAMVTRWV